MLDALEFAGINSCNRIPNRSILKLRFIWRKIAVSHSHSLFLGMGIYEVKKLDSKDSGKAETLYNLVTQNTFLYTFTKCLSQT
jgi:hypothetical protein